MNEVTFYISPVKVKQILLNLSLYHCLKSNISHIGVRFWAEYVTKSGTEVACEITARDSNADLAVLIESADMTKGIYAYWSVVPMCVLPFGSGISRTGSKTAIMPPPMYTSKTAFAKLINSVAVAFAKKGGKDGSNPDAVTLAVIVKGVTRVINEDNVHLISGCNVFVSKSKDSYSNLNYLVLEKVEVNLPDTKPEDYLKEMKKQDQTKFQSRCRCAVEHFRTFYCDWVVQIDECSKDLAGWSKIMPSQAGFNEATRRVIVNVLLKHVSLLTDQYVFFEPPLAPSGKSPPYMVGTGPLDGVVIGRAVIHVTIKMENVEIDDDDDQSEEEFTDSEEEFPSLFQLSGECHDLSYVHPDTLLDLSSAGGSENDPQCKKEVAESVKRHTATSSFKRSREESNSAEVVSPNREFLEVAAVLTTGHTWDFLLYSTTTLNPSEKQRVSFLGTLNLGVFVYRSLKEPETSSSASKAAASGDTRPGSIDRASVELLIAALILATTGRLSGPLTGEHR